MKQRSISTVTLTKQTFSKNDLSESGFNAYVSETRKRIDLELSEFVKGISDLTLQPQLEYAILSEGKRLRPLLIVLSAESVGGNRNEIIHLALAFELMHTATLVHDDIIDQDEMRRGRLAVHRKWSVSDAILTGDALIALAVNLASEYGETVLKTMTRSALQLCDGAHKDVTLPLRKVTEKSYFKKIEEKSASLFKASAFCGALAGGGTPMEIDSLSAFAENLGIAYQLKDDIIDFSQEEKIVSKDLKGGVVNLPLIHTYALSSLSEKQEIEKDLQAILNKSLEEGYENVKNVVDLVIQTGSFRYCEQKIEEYLQRAVSSLSPLKDTKYKGYLVDMTRILKTLK